MFRTFCLIFLAIVPATLRAAIIKVPADQPTIQAGINAANPGDTVLVAPGTYYENLTIDAKEIILKSEQGASTTIIDGGRKGVVIFIVGNKSVATTIDGFTIRDGGTNYSPSDGGIEVGAAGATIQNNIIAGNYGYGIDASGGAVNVLSNHIVTTSPTAGQGYCYVYAQTAVNISGGINDASGNPITNNVSGNLIEGDGTFCSGNGIYYDSEYPITVENNTVRNNVSGISILFPFFSANNAIVRQNLIYGNQQGGIYVDSGVLIGSTQPTTEPAHFFLVNNTLYNNLTAFSQPNSPQQQSTGEITIEDAYAQVALYNNLIIANSSSSPAIACLQDHYPPGLNFNATPLLVDHNDIYNTNPSAPGLYLNNCSNSQSDIGINGNISVNPGFLSPADFHLPVSSPAVDAGNNSANALPSADLSGNPRILDSKGSGYPVVDMGVYEAAGTNDAIPVTLSLIASSYDLPIKTPVTLTATPSAAGGAPAGTVTFFSNGAPIGTILVAAGGSASLTTSFPIGILYDITAQYTGPAGYAPAISTVVYIRVPPVLTTLTISSSLNPSIVGQPVTFTATVFSPDGTIPSPINFYTDGSGTPAATVTTNASGIATFTTSALAVGTHYVWATFPGDVSRLSSTDTVLQTVLAGYPDTITLTSSLNPSTYGQPITLTAAVAFSDNGSSTSAAGTISFFDGGSLLATRPINEQGLTTSSVTFTAVNLLAVNHNLTAVLNPVNNFEPNSAALTQTIIGAPTTTLLAPAIPNPANALQPVTLTASVSTGTSTIATGTITFFDSGTSLGTATLDATGHATYITSTLTTRIHTINAVYSGDTSFATSTSNNITETITANPTFTTLSVSPTQSQAFQFFNVTVGVSSLTSVPFSTQSCSPTCTATMTITGLPSNQNSTVTAPILASGTATFKYALAVGTYTFIATFNGSSAFNSSTSGVLSETVVPATTTLTLAASPTTVNQNQSVAFTSVFTAPLSTEIPSGTITLLDGATPFATAPFTGNPLSNTATISATSTTLSVGTHIITATYPGNPNFLPISSAPITVVINANDFTVATSTPNPTIPTEHHLAIPINLSSIGVFADQVTLACTNLPVWTTCTFDQNTLPLTAGGTATTSLTIDTSSVLRYARNQSPITAKSITFAFTLPAGIIGLFLTRRRRFPLRLTLFFLTTLAATLTLTGCTGMYPLSTPPGTYTLNITAHGTTTGISHTLPITLTITP